MARATAQPEEDMGSNVTSDLIMEALSSYTQDKGAHDRTGMTIARNQAKFQRLGVEADLVRQMHKEAKLSADERQSKYADELRYRKAVSLWDAETEEEFDQAMQAASETAAASARSAELLVGARSYNDGFNSAVKAKLKADDNPHAAGTVQHAHWARGCKDGIKHLRDIGEDVPPEEPVITKVPAGKRGGRPKKVAAAEPSAGRNGPAADQGAGLLGGALGEPPF